MRGDIALFLGLVVVIGGGVVVAVVFLFGGGGGGRSVCENPLPSLGESDISQLGFQTEDVGMAGVIQAGSAGDIAAANETFYANNREVHDFTHNIDAGLRLVDEVLAEDLCKAVIRLEEEFQLDRRPEVIVAEATLIRDLLRDAAEALGFARPGE